MAQGVELGPEGGVLGGERLSVDRGRHGVGGGHLGGGTERQRVGGHVVEGDGRDVLPAAVLGDAGDGYAVVGGLGGEPAAEAVPGEAVNSLPAGVLGAGSSTPLMRL